MCQRGTQLFNLFKFHRLVWRPQVQNRKKKRGNTTAKNQKKERIKMKDPLSFQVFTNCMTRTKEHSLNRVQQTFIGMKKRMQQMMRHLLPGNSVRFRRLPAQITIIAGEAITAVFADNYFVTDFRL